MSPLDSTLKSTLAELSLIVTFPPSNSTAVEIVTAPVESAMAIAAVPSFALTVPVCRSEVMMSAVVVMLPAI